MRRGDEHISSPATSRGRDVALLCALVLFACGARSYQLSQPNVMSRDGIGYAHYAWLLEQQPWQDVVRSSRHHPGFPVAVFGVAKVVRLVVDAPETLLLQWSAQLTSCLASILLIIPMYWLVKAWFDRSTAVGAILLFQVLPCTGILFADALSEPLFLLCAITSLWCATEAVRSGKLLVFALSGAFSGLAYLVRPEGAILAAFTGLTLLATRLCGLNRFTVRRVAAGSCALSLGFLAAAAPLMITIERLTCKTSANIVLSGETSAAVHPLSIPCRPDLILDQWRAVTLAQPSRPIEPSTGTGVLNAPLPAPPAVPESRWKPIQSLTGALAKGMLFYLWLPAVLGLWICRGRLLAMPGMWILGAAAATIVLLMWRIAATLGYVSERHLVLVIFMGTVWASVGLCEWARRLGSGFIPDRTRLAMAIVFAMAVGSPLVKTLQPLHADRTGYRDAGDWLAAHTNENDLILDPHMWAAYYAGRAFRYVDELPPTGSVRHLYVVLNPDGAKSKVPVLPAARELASLGREVYRNTSVVVYVVPADPAERQ